MSSRDSTAFLFLSQFIGEGTATKLVNNHPGGAVPSIDSTRLPGIFYGQVAEWWKKYTDNEADLFKHYVETFEGILSGKIGRKELSEDNAKFWLTGFVSPIYFVGAELFGAIYYGYGKAGVFEAMNDPRMIPFLYNSALKLKPAILDKCIKLPDALVEAALSLGKN